MENRSIYLSYGKAALTDLVGFLLLVEMLPLQPVEAAIELTRILEERGKLDVSKPMVVRHPTTGVWLCDGRLIPDRMAAVPVIRDVVEDEKIIVLIGNKEQIIDYSTVAYETWWARTINTTNDVLMDVLMHYMARHENQIISQSFVGRTVLSPTDEREYQVERLVLMNSSVNLLTVVRILTGSGASRLYFNLLSTIDWITNSWRQTESEVESVQLQILPNYSEMRRYYSRDGDLGNFWRDR